ncbi:hypothetical protein pb186bvf_000639 [Paramecium bursaria]
MINSFQFLGFEIKSFSALNQKNYQQNQHHQQLYFCKNKSIQGAKGNYKILGLIAAGTGGMVMSGIMNNMTKVAVKYQSFISEHETNVCLRFLENKFSNIVNILDIFKNQSHPGFFIIMDFADMPLTKYINGKIEFGNTKSLQFQTMIKQICCGIHELHQMKIIHRDFKPDNIVVQVENNQAKKYMLCDLGLVRSDENDFKKTKQIGTPMFMAPELLNEDKYSVRVDIWALGCMLYSLLARKHLFEGNTVQETLRQVSQITQLEINAKINQIQNLDQEFKQLLIKMIQIKQSDRLTIEQVIEQINNYYNNQQQAPIIKGQFQMNTQFLPQQIIIYQKPKLLPQQQLKIEQDRIQKSNDIQCNQMKDNLLHRLIEQEQQLVSQNCKNDQQYSSQQVQQIIQQAIIMVKKKSFDIIDQLYVVKLESDKKVLQEQLGQKELKQNGHQTEINQKQMEINKNKDLINDFIKEKKENEDKINDMSQQLQQSQSQIHSQNQQMFIQSEEINVLKAHLELSIKELQIKEQILQNKDQIHLQEINKHLSLEGELQSEIHSLKQNLANIQQEFTQQKQLLIQEIENKKQQEIDRLLEENQKYFNQYEQQKQFIQQNIPELENTIEELNRKLKSAEEQLEQVQQGQYQQNEKKTSENEGLNKNQVMQGHLQKLMDYLKQQENSQKIESDQMKNDIFFPIQNNNEQTQNEVQSEIQTNTNFTQQIFSPNQSTNIIPQNNYHQQNGSPQQQFQPFKNTNRPQIQQQQLQQKQPQFQNSNAQQFQSAQNLNNNQQPHNFVNSNNTPLQFMNQNSQNLAAQQQEQINSKVQQPQSRSQILKTNFVLNIIPNIRKNNYNIIQRKYLQINFTTF